MATLKEDALIVAGIGLAVIVIAWYLKKKVGDAGAAVAEVVSDAAGAAWDAAAQGAKVGGDVIAWPVLATGDVLGIPRTNMTECERAKAEGRTWDASFACPAGDFLGYVFN